MLFQFEFSHWELFSKLSVAKTVINIHHMNSNLSRFQSLKAAHMDITMIIWFSGKKYQKIRGRALVGKQLHVQTCSKDMFFYATTIYWYKNCKKHGSMVSTQLDVWETTCKLDKSQYPSMIRRPLSVWEIPFSRYSISSVSTILFSHYRRPFLFPVCSRTSCF